MKQTEEQFFELLRAGLWNRAANTSLFEGVATDWADIYRISKEQTVVGIVYDGMCTLPNELRPEKRTKLKWYAKVGIIEQRNKELNKVLAEIFSLYKAQGFTPILLKGQGVASLYPTPLHRQCGDIDVLVGEEDYERVNEYVRTLSANCDEHENEKHYTFNYKGVTIENHHCVAEIPPASRNRTLQRQTQAWFPHSEASTQIGNEQISLPPVPFNAAFLLIHAHHHLMTEGVGLRQLCDMALFIHKHAAETRQMEELIKELNMADIWAVYLTFFETYLGLPKVDVGLKRKTAKAEKMRRLVLRNGNFGHADPLRQNLQTNYWIYKMQSVGLHLIHFAHLLPIFPREVVNEVLFLFPNGIRRVVKYGT